MNTSDLNVECGGGTVVSFPRGETTCQSRVVFAEGISGGDGTAVIVTIESPFHPLDHAWPDQPGDTGHLEIDGQSLAVIDSVTAVVSPSSRGLLVGEAVTARRRDPDSIFVVAHVTRLGDYIRPDDLIGASVDLFVDQERRRHLSASHSACHLMALALNKHTRELWRKQVRTDSLGHPDFDQYAITESRMSPQESQDRYRLGKSLRKSGFDVGSLLCDLDEIRSSVQRQLGDWIESAAPITIDVSDPRLSAARAWVCGLPEGTARLPCGGTHLSSSSEYLSIDVDFVCVPDNASELTVLTRPRLRS